MNTVQSLATSATANSSCKSLIVYNVRTLYDRPSINASREHVQFSLRKNILEIPFEMKRYPIPMRRIELLILLILLATIPIARAAGPKDQPNIIFLMTDDQRWDNMGCYGRPEFKTPNLDALAEQGVIFDQAFDTVAICMPSRVTMMTGRYISSHRVGFVAPNDYTLSQADFGQGYPAQLKNAGYRTGFIGKVGFTVSKEAKRPWAGVPYDYQGNMGNVFDFFAGAETTEEKALEVWPENDPKLQAIFKNKKKGESRTLRTGETILHFLDTQPEDQPFCLSVSFYAVKHDSNSHMYMPHYELFKDYDFSVPDNWVEGANESLPQVVKDHARGVYLHRDRTSTPALYQRQVRRFATQGYTVDQQVGRMMEKLKEMGQLENTVIIYTSDNGRFQGSHGLFDKCILYEEAVKAPLIVYDGRMDASKRGRREEALISSVDMAPTILSLAGLEQPKIMQGRDFSGVLNQTQDMSSWRDAVLIENLFLVSMFNAKNKPNALEINQGVIDRNESYRSRGVRTDRYKYFVYYEHNPPIEELYDIEKDPQEQNNLVNNPEYAEPLKKLRKRTEELYSEAVQ
ncbi:Arylsulfatase [Novipirellula aureliae]|uniref:Arylsulfatase n=1 Tax=Novipirellula aureliae TaxID=2527966 RepID=A0A5C6DNG9_9BACT|nr:sulfatase-like hydrolase/transferase [Novipirellula aureliae]TWU38833.1 Arylsulfatase [Novipirellula aureliae]